jgi:hypothetical protein
MSSQPFPIGEDPDVQLISCKTGLDGEPLAGADPAVRNRPEADKVPDRCRTMSDTDIQPISAEQSSGEKPLAGPSQVVGDRPDPGTMSGECCSFSIDLNS